MGNIISEIIYVKPLLVRMWENFNSEKGFHWVETGYHFKLSKRKIPVLSCCFVKNQAGWHRCWLHLSSGKRFLWRSMFLQSCRFITMPVFWRKRIFVLKKCQKNIPDLVKAVLEYRPGLRFRSYLQSIKEKKIT